MFTVIININYHDIFIHLADVANIVVMTIELSRYVVSAFPTERWELQLVARKLERRGHISYKDFVAYLKAVSITSVTVRLAFMHPKLILYVFPIFPMPLYTLSSIQSTLRIFLNSPN